MALWADTTLTTDTGLRRYESIITDLKSLVDGSGQASTVGSSAVVSVPEADLPLFSVGAYMMADDTTVTVLSIDEDNETVTVSQAVDWSSGVDYQVQSWAGKIALARESIANRITLALIDSGRVVSRSAGQEYIDLVANPERFAVACDYLTLSLIYQELMSAGSQELYYEKSRIYEQRYERELALALRTIDISTDLTGTATEYDQSASICSPCLR